MAESLREKSVRGVVWSAIERFSLLGVQFVIQVVLARLLSPSDYGLVGMLAVFLAVSQAFIDCGFTNALIQNQQRTERDFATAFFFNAAVSVLFYVLLFAGAPLIADFYDMPALVSVTRVIGFSLVLAALSAVHRTKLTIRVDFKKQAQASLSAVVLSGVVGIAMAYNGFGVWALVAQTLVNRGANSLFLWLLIRWHPQHFFSVASFKPMFSYGSKLVVAHLLHTIYTNLYSLVIGKVFSAAALGFYSRADQMAGLPATSGSAILTRVTFPLLATVQNDDARLSDVYRRYMRVATGAIVPVMLGLCALSEPIVVVLLGEKWLPAVPLMRVLCLAWMLDPMTLVNLNLLNVKGRSDLVLRLEIIKKTTATLILFAGLPFGLMGLCVGRAIYSQIALAMNSYYTGKFLKMTYWRQMREVVPIYSLAAVMGVVAFVVTIPFDNPWVQIVVGVAVGAVIYIAGAKIFKFEILDEALAMLVKAKNLVFKSK
ncbi:MAG: lipopolysaccharide biosynthesis protein [Opitutae bacterium]|nr:lipopolysaccharide biosynthesis protein [Opitutae bacterium]MCD8298572.1 lipopolysaccharide biosynthesis protein [Opitutae bacterium]